MPVRARARRARAPSGVSHASFASRSRLHSRGVAAAQRVQLDRPPAQRRRPAGVQGAGPAQPPSSSGITVTSPPAATSVTSSSMTIRQFARAMRASSASVAVADRLDDVAAVGVPHDRAVQVLPVAQRREQLLAGDRLHGAPEQLPLAQHQPDRRADEHLEGHQRGHRLTGHADHRDVVAAEPAEALRRARGAW